MPGTSLGPLTTRKRHPGVVLIVSRPLCVMLIARHPPGMVPIASHQIMILIAHHLGVVLIVSQPPGGLLIVSHLLSVMLIASHSAILQGQCVRCQLRREEVHMWILYRRRRL
jgi:hypothetical protein